MGNICELSTDPRAEAYGVRTQGNGREELLCRCCRCFALLAALVPFGPLSKILGLFLVGHSTQEHGGWGMRAQGNGREGLPRRCCRLCSKKCPLFKFWGPLPSWSQCPRAQSQCPRAQRTGADAGQQRKGGVTPLLLPLLCYLL